MANNISRDGYCECGHLVHPNDKICTDCLNTLLHEPGHAKRAPLRI